MMSDAAVSEEMVDESAIDTTSGSNYQDAVDVSAVTALINTTSELSLDETPKSEDLANNSSRAWRHFSFNKVGF